MTVSRATDLVSFLHSTAELPAHWSFVHVAALGDHLLAKRLIESGLRYAPSQAGGGKKGFRLVCASKWSKLGGGGLRRCCARARARARVCVCVCVCVCVICECCHSSQFRTHRLPFQPFYFDGNSMRAPNPEGLSPMGVFAARGEVRLKF